MFRSSLLAEHTNKLGYETSLSRDLLLNVRKCTSAQCFSYDIHVVDIHRKMTLSLSVTLSLFLNVYIISLSLMTESLKNRATPHTHNLSPSLVIIPSCCSEHMLGLCLSHLKLNILTIMSCHNVMIRVILASLTPAPHCQCWWRDFGTKYCITV